MVCVLCECVGYAGFLFLDRIRYFTAGAAWMYEEKETGQFRAAGCVCVWKGGIGGLIADSPFLGFANQPREKASSSFNELQYAASDLDCSGCCAPTAPSREEGWNHHCPRWRSHCRSDFVHS